MNCGLFVLNPHLQTPVKKGSGCLRAHASLLPSVKISADGNLASKLARLAGEADSIRWCNHYNKSTSQDCDTNMISHCLTLETHRTCAIFLKSKGLKDIKYGIPMHHIENTKIQSAGNIQHGFSYSSMLLREEWMKWENTWWKWKWFQQKMLERSKMGYIFEELGVQILHSHVPIPFNSAPAHLTLPHNAKWLFMSSFQAKFQKIRFAIPRIFLMAEQKQKIFFSM